MAEQNVDTRQPRPNQALDQRRGKHAWKLVQAAVASHDEKDKAKNKKKFGRHAKKLPMRILASGLGQSLAFIHGKGEAKLLMEGLSEWVLAKSVNPNAELPAAPPADRALILAILDRDSDFLREATDKALAYLQWVNRFADAEGITDDEE